MFKNNEHQKTNIHVKKQQTLNIHVQKQKNLKRGSES